MDSQVELFPFAAPETVLAYCRRLENKVLKVAAELTPRDCLRLLGELELATAVLETISRSIESSPAWRRREQLPPVAPGAIERADVRIVLPPHAPPRWARARRRGGLRSSS